MIQQLTEPSQLTAVKRQTTGSAAPLEYHFQEIRFEGLLKGSPLQRQSRRASDVRS